MILHMLRWVLGDQNLMWPCVRRQLKFAGQSASLDDFRANREEQYGEKLTWSSRNGWTQPALRSSSRNIRFTAWGIIKGSGL